MARDSANPMTLPIELSSAALNRYGGIARLYGQRALARFQGAHVAVIGIGGVGSWAAEALARSGIGRITLFDMDEVCTTNTNRQILALSQTVGQSKVAVMRDRLLAIDPDLQVDAHFSFVTERNVAEALQGFDFVIDAIDSVRSKCAILHHCRRNKLKIITVGGAGGQTDPTRIRTADLSRTYHDPLLAKVRRTLRQEYGWPDNPQRRFGIEAVFSEEQPVYPDAQGEVCAVKPAPGESARLDCSSGYGAVTCVTGTFGFVAVARVLAKLAQSAAPPNPSAG